MDLAVSSTDLYYAVSGQGGAVLGDWGAVMRVPLRGSGTPVTVASFVGSEQALLLVGDSLVFAQAPPDPTGGATGAVVRVGLNGGDSQVLASASIVPATIFGPNGILASDGQNVYFAAQDGTKRVALTGGPVQTMTTYTGAIALVGTNLIVADAAAGGVFGVPLAGGTITALATNLPGSLGPVLGCGQSICWASATQEGLGGSGNLMRLDPSGALVSLSQDFFVGYRVLFDGTNFFATLLADASPGTALEVPAAGGAPVTLGLYSGIAIDDDCVYLGSVITGISSVPK
jgi:hypothetical protein